MNTKQIMKRGWDIARDAAWKFSRGLRVRSYLAMSLRQAWAEAKGLIAKPSNRKAIAQDLDRAAQNAAIIGATPATTKQTWFLAGLLDAKGLTAADIDCGICATNAVLTIRRASSWIDQMKAA